MPDICGNDSSSSSNIVDSVVHAGHTNDMVPVIAHVITASHSGVGFADHMNYDVVAPKSHGARASDTLEI